MYASRLPPTPNHRIKQSPPGDIKKEKKNYGNMGNENFGKLNETLPFFFPQSCSARKGAYILVRERNVYPTVKTCWTYSMFAIRCKLGKPQK